MASHRSRRLNVRERPLDPQGGDGVNGFGTRAQLSSGECPLRQRFFDRTCELILIW